MKSSILIVLALSVAPILSVCSAPAVVGVAHVVALRALAAPVTSSDSMVADTAGYTTPGDGGGHRFIWDAGSNATDNGGTVVKPGNVTTGAGRWVALFEESSSAGKKVNVKWFGAKGDGTSDDTDPIYNAMGVLPPATNYGYPRYESGYPATPWQGVLYFPAGNYCVRKTGIPMFELCTIQGAGKGLTQVRFVQGAFSEYDSENYLIRVYRSKVALGNESPAPRGNFTHNVHIEDIGIFAEQGQPPASKASGLLYSGAEGSAGSSSLKNISVTGYEHALVMQDCGTTLASNISASLSRKEAFTLQGQCNHVFIDVAVSEHMLGSEVDGDGDVRAHVLVDGCNNVHFGAVFVEASADYSHNGMKIRQSLGVTVDGFDGNLVHDAVIINGESDMVEIGSLFLTAASGVAIRDTSHVGSWNKRNYVQVETGGYKQRFATDDIIVPASQHGKGVALIGGGTYELSPQLRFIGGPNRDVQNGDLTMAGFPGAFSSATNTGDILLRADGTNLLLGTNGSAGQIKFISGTAGSETTKAQMFPSGGFSLGNNADPGFGNLRANTVYAANLVVPSNGTVSVPASNLTGVAPAGIQSQPISVVHSDPYSPTNADRGTRQVYNSSNANPLQVTLDVPSTTGNFANGWYFLASNTGVAPVTFYAPAGRTIDGQSKVSIPGHTLAVITSDGTNYVTSLAGAGGERLIDFYELTQSTNSLTIAIPPGLHHLHLLSSCQTTNSVQCILLGQMNDDSNPAHYLLQYLSANGSNVSAGQVSTPQYSGLYVGQMNASSASAPAQSDVVISLDRYPLTGAPTYLANSLGRACYNYLDQYILVNGTARWSGGSTPVSTITLKAAFGNIAANSTFYLYGY